MVGTTGGTERLDLSGTWRSDGTGALRAVARGFYLDTLAATEDGPTAFGGVLDVDAVIRGTREQPIVTGNIAVTDGRVRRLAYEKLEGRVEYFDGLFEVNLRLDQSPDVWLAARGTVPLGLFDPAQPERSMHVAIVSTSISLGLVEGLTGAVREVTGQARLDLTVTGSSLHPDLLGSIEIADAGFLVTATGVRYGSGRALLELSKDRIVVSSVHVEDSGGQPLDIRGSLGTHELRLQDLELEVVGKGLEILRNEFGTAQADIQLLAGGQLESPRLTGRITVLGGELIVDRILDRTLFQPYATEAEAPIADLDALAALNPWDRLGLDIELQVPGSLRMTGDNVQVSPGTPIGLGDIDLRATGDLYLYKDPGQPLYVTGSLDQITGAYVFQGRRFDLDPRSSIVFRGDLSPDLYVTVRRVISGVETRVSIEGPLQEPELRLTSTPPLDPSDVLSLIVFNTTANQLSSSQQEQLAVRAGTLAAAFLASPLTSALERTLGLETLGIEPATGIGGGARVTIGDEIAPGLVARFSRQFGQDQYDEVTLEYYLSRILRIRGTLSDATALTVGAPFRRVERAGVDLLVFFSF
jgi:translocation and assembly module TamB